MSQSIRAMVEEFSRGGMLKTSEVFEEQVRHDVMMDLIDIANKCSVNQLKAEAEKLFSTKQRSNGKTEAIYQEYLEYVSRVKSPHKSSIREYLDELRAPFYVPGKPGGGYGRRSYDYAAQDFTFGGSSGTSPSTLHGEQMGTVEEAYQFRKRYLPLYIEILQDILQNA